MQIIQSIRKRAVIATAAIAIAIIGFILLDAKNGSNKLFSASNSSVGTVNGESIDYATFNSKVKMTEDRYGGKASDMTYMIRKNVWDQFVSESVLNSELNKMGLVMSPKELGSILFSPNAPDSWKQLFTDKNTGQYDIMKAEQWWKTQFKKIKQEDRNSLEAEIIEPLRLQTLYMKYSGLVAAGAYVPTWMADKDRTDSKTFANISYVSVPYSKISDSSVKVSDEDINDYVKNHAAMYKQDGGRVVSYVAFSAKPNSQDSMMALNSLLSIKQNFIADTNAKKFLAMNGSAKNFSDSYVPASKITSSKKDSILSLSKDGVFGPYLDDKDFVIAKFIDSRMIPDSVKCRHILIATVDPKSGQPTISDSVAKKRIDSIAALIKNGASFDSLVAKYSDDEGSKDKGGVYDFDYSQFDNLAKEFASTIFYGTTGDKKVVHTEFGWHYIEVLNQSKIEKAYKIAYMAKDIIASDETQNYAQSEATKLTSSARDLKTFNTYVTQNNLKKIDAQKTLEENDYSINDLQDARDLIRWAFDAKEGEVSDRVFPIGEQYVVAVLTKIIPKGLPDAATARPLVENLIRNKKKADMIIAKLGNSPSFETASSAYGAVVQNAGADSTLTFSSQFINGVGQEPRVIGISFDKDMQAKISEPIPGNSGVFLVKVSSIGTKPDGSPESIAQDNLNKAKNKMMQFSYGWFEALKKNADIKDNRSKFY